MTIHNGNSTIQMMQLITGKWISKPIYVAAELGIADILSEGPLTIKEISEKSDTHEPYLYRIMRTLASVGIFTEIEDKKFAMTPMAQTLRTGAMRSIAQMFLSEWHDQAWNSLLHSVKTGEIAFNNAHGMPSFKWFEKNKNEAEIFNKANSIKAKNFHRAFLDAYDFSNIDTVADIGGGYGGLVVEIFKYNKHISGTIADLPHVIAKTAKIIKTEGFSDRCKTVECNFFKTIPENHEVYILYNILHDWDDDNSRIILKNCSRSMPQKSILLIIEMIIPGRNEFSISKLLDIEVLVMGGGRERTEEEYKKLLTSSGFVIEKIIPTKELFSIIECMKK